MHHHASSLNDRLALPLAECIRPTTLDEYIGQHHLLGENGAIANFLWLGYLPSMILCGPPGVGKTTLASIMASYTGYVFVELSATDTTVGHLREVSAEIKAENLSRSRSGHARLRVVVFIDEIHRFSTTQQDFLLPFVEAGDFVFIGATSVDPSKRIRRAILSRCQVFTLEPLSIDDILRVVRKAVLYENIRRKMVRKLRFITYGNEALQVVAEYCNGDTRTTINCIELLSSRYSNEEHQNSGEGSESVENVSYEPLVITASEVEAAVKSLTKARLGLRHETNVPLFVQLFNCMNGVVACCGTTEPKPLVSAQKNDTSYVVTIRLREVTLALIDDDMDVKKGIHLSNFALRDAGISRKSKEEKYYTSSRDTHSEVTMPILKVSDQESNASKVMDSALANEKRDAWAIHMDYSDDSDVEPGKVYSDYEDELPSLSRSSVSDFRSEAAAHTMLILLQKDESALFILKQLVLFVCMYVLTDLNELPKIISVVKALKQSSTDPVKLLSVWVDRLCRLPKVPAQVKLIRLIKKYCSKEVVVKEYTESSDLEVVYDELLEQELLTEPPASNPDQTISTFVVEDDMDADYTLGWQAGTPHDITLQ